jgi:alkanesulfonate monooxygenase SsuD/methylene tetrahydromethanopterin reductase-like flavin-dependent oxidoreductase (luciferase family)
MSSAAIRRAVRFGDAWHPVNPSLDWLRDVALPQLHEVAGTFGRLIPDLSPRIRARLTAHDVSAMDRPSGVGSIAQVLDDLARLDELGATHVVPTPTSLVAALA